MSAEDYINYMGVERPSKTTKEAKQWIDLWNSGTMDLDTILKKIPTNTTK